MPGRRRASERGSVAEAARRVIAALQQSGWAGAPGKVKVKLAGYLTRKESVLRFSFSL